MKRRFQSYSSRTTSKTALFLDHVNQDLNMIRHDIAVALFNNDGRFMLPQHCLDAINNPNNQKAITLDCNGDENDDTSTTTNFQDEQEQTLFVGGVVENEEMNVFSTSKKGSRPKQRQLWRRLHQQNTTTKRQTRRSVAAYDFSWRPSLGFFC